MSTGADFTRALAEAVERTGVSLAALETACHEAGTPVSAAALSYWVNGHSLPRRKTSFAVVATLERELDLEAGALLRHLDVGRDGWELSRSGRPFEDDLSRCRRELGLPDDDGLHRDMVLARCCFDRDPRVDTTFLLRAREDGADHLLVSVAEDLGPFDADEPPITVVRGGRLDGIARLGPGQVVVVVRFDEPMVKGERRSVQVRREITAPRGTVTEFIAATRNPVGVLSVQVRLPRDERPPVVLAETQRWDADGAVVERTGPHRHRSEHVVQASLAELFAGLVRLSWTWPGAED